MSCATKEAFDLVEQALNTAGRVEEVPSYLAEGESFSTRQSAVLYAEIWAALRLCKPYADDVRFMGAVAEILRVNE